MFAYSSPSPAKALFAPNSPTLSRYDPQIKSAVKLYWSDYPIWEAWWGQLYQESNLNPTAKSGVGAEGLAQFMPGTWSDMTKAMRLGMVPRTDANYAITVGAYYMSKLRGNWSPTKNRTAEDRNQLAQASYNAGYGWIAKAQTRCGGGVSNPLTWPEISPCLEFITSKASAGQTLDYVVKIDKWMSLKMEGVDP